jgi:hypothetical protein
MRRERRRWSKDSSGGDRFTARSRSRSQTYRSNSRSSPDDGESGAVTKDAALRILGFAEALYAMVALVLAFALPLPPRGPGIVLFSHYLGTALLASAIALRVRRPNRQMWYVAALLSAYVLFNAVVAVWRMLGPEATALGRPGTIALAVGGFLWAAQLLAAFCLYSAGEVRTMPSAPRRR